MSTHADTRVLVVDTETTGILSADGGTGRMVQLAWIELDEASREIGVRSLLVRPEGFVIPPEATAIHGITNERASNEGVPLAEALGLLAEAAHGVRDVVAHNADFDRAVIVSEASRLGVPDPLASAKWNCTMRAGKPVCRIPGKYGWKLPTLEELHRHLFGQAFEGAHDALADARAAARCYKRLHEIGAIGLAPPFAPPPPTAEQSRALEALDHFLNGKRAAFILLGAGGTGKTTLLRHLAASIEARGRTVCLLAPTGRAARVVAQRTGRNAETIHSHLYSFNEVQTDGTDLNSDVALVFGQKRNDDPPGTVYVIDEASMVSDHKNEEDGMLRFGSGRLLTDLFRFAALHDRERRNHVVFVGDPAQLPPVGSPNSPALSARVLAERHGLEAEVFELTEVLRQGENSGILASAHRLRHQIVTGDFASLALDENAADVEVASHEEIVPTYLETVAADGPDAAVLITRTNKAATALNASVRRALYGKVADLVKGDRLIVVQNNLLHQLFNGDFIEVVAMSEQVEERRSLGVTLSWREVTVRVVGSERKITTLLMDNLMTSVTGNLTPEEVQALIVDFRKRHPGLKPKDSAFGEKLRCDPYVQALRARHGYALTCHKAQGGEWTTAIIVFDGRDRGWDNEHYFRWTYTAITRARCRLVAVRPPRHSAISDLVWTVGASSSDAPTLPPKSDGMEALLARAGISLTVTQEMPYRRRLTLTREGTVGRVDLVYDGKRIIKSVQVLGSGPGRALAVETAALLAPLVGTLLDDKGVAKEATPPKAFEPPAGFFDGQPHLAALYEQFRRALNGTGIVIENIEHHPWMERYTFRRNIEYAKIDVYYNAKGRFTKARAVHPSALADEIQTRWSRL
jgi:DNA polymerase III epsilon subunit-like protein